MGLAGEIVYRCTNLVVKAAPLLMGVRLRIDGRHNLPTTPAVIVSNHVSYLDPFLIVHACYEAGLRVRFLALPSQVTSKITGPYMRAVRSIPIGRDGGKSAYRGALEAFRRGDSVGVFPEGTVARSYALQELKSGAAHIAIDAGVPVVPVAVWGPQRLWTTGRREVSRRGVPVTLLIGEPFRPGAGDGPGQVTAELRRQMLSLLERAQREYPDSGSGQWWQPCHLGGTAPTPGEAEAMDAADNAARAR
ncbi:lysophospholipid acyltransferase family protein [Saccharothrix isguenensis]